MFYVVYTDGQSDGSSDTYDRHIFKSYQDAVNYFGDRLGSHWDDRYPDGYWDHGSISDPEPVDELTDSYRCDIYGPGVMHGPEEYQPRFGKQTFDGLVFKDW